MGGAADSGRPDPPSAGSADEGRTEVPERTGGGPMARNRGLAIGLGGTVATVLLMLPVVTAWLAPLPVMYCLARLGTAVGLGVIVASSVALSELGTGLALVYAINFGLAGFVIVEALRRRQGFQRALLASVAAVVVANAANLVMESRAAGQTVAEWLAAEVERGYEMSRELFAPPAADDLALEAPAPPMPPVPEDAGEALEAAKGLVVRAVPAMMIWSAAAVVLANMLLARRLFARRLKTALFEYGELRRWSAPDAWVWALIAAGGVLMFREVAGTEAWDTSATVALNVLLVMLLVYFLQGLAITAFYLERSKMPAFAGGVVRVLAYAMILTSAPLMAVVTGVGVFDMWVDFRRMRRRERPAEPDDD